LLTRTAFPYNLPRYWGNLEMESKSKLWLFIYFFLWGTAF